MKFLSPQYVPATKVIPPDDVQIWLAFNYAGNAFLESLREQLLKYGTLSEKQIEAIRKNMVPKPPPVTTAANAQKIIEAFQLAKQQGLKYPSLQIGPYLFKLSPPNGKHPGAIYVSEKSNYLGRIDGTQYYPSFKSSVVKTADIEAICIDPMKAAMEYGKMTGRCSCCGKELSDPESVALGIGPVCKKKFFG